MKLKTRHLTLLALFFWSPIHAQSPTPNPISAPAEPELVKEDDTARLNAKKKPRHSESAPITKSRPQKKGLHPAPPPKTN